ncbi:MAG: hypothetical protein HY791_37545 [Deltaproteobacteria bacterium]|nr:hypothetical protein [Deltaproteobacteria bacterium]
MSRRLSAVGTALIVASISQAACVKQLMVDGQIEATREAAAAFDTIGDFELTQAGAASGLTQFEGMLLLAPNNPDALFLLTKGWTGFAWGFIEDDFERAEDAGDRAAADYHKARAVAAYDRAIGYGLQLITQDAAGFQEARKSEASLDEWLVEGFDEQADAQGLFWLGYAWASRANLLKDDAETVANVYVGAKFLERSVALDPSYTHSAASVVLAAYHARSAMAELDLAKQMFDQLLVKESNFLLIRLQYATRYACAKADGELYRKLLEEILAVKDFASDLRLMNTIAQRRARRWLGEQRMFDACGIEAPGGSENAT